MRTPQERLVRICDSIVLGDENARTMALHQALTPMTVWVRPAEGDTVNLWYSTDDGANWNEWQHGAVTEYTESVFISPVTHIKAERTDGEGTTSAFGVC